MTGRLVSAADIANDFNVVPDEPGVYAWFFKAVPPGVPIAGCVTRGGRTLLYIGIAPRHRKTGTDKTRRTLRSRLKNHLNGNVKSSTLRLSLAGLLRVRLDLAPSKTSRGSLTLGKGEARLSRWLRKEASVLWLKHDSPWVLEDELIERLVLPLNLRGNPANAFAETLSEARRRIWST